MYPHQRLVSMAIIASLFLGSVCAAETFPGEKSDWNGFERWDFEVNGKPVLVVAPKSAREGNPWVWHGEFFGHKPEPDIELLKRGFHIVYISVPNLFGAPQAVSHWNDLYSELTGKYGFAKKAALVGLSRGGLYCYNWAEANPEKVACIFGDAPVCDVKSWPCGKGKGRGNAAEVTRLMEVYGVTTEEELFAKVLNPIDHLDVLAKANVPLLHLYGDADLDVPWEENTGVLAERYRALGGTIHLIAKPGVGHVHGLDDPTPIVEFIDQSCTAALAKIEPISIGGRRELFVDYFLIERLTNLSLRLHEPRDEGIALKFDLPFEGPFSGYATLIRDNDRIRLYYRGLAEAGLDGSKNERTCYAESNDGVNWSKPNLGLFEYRGNRENNIVLANAAPATHNFCPMLDPRKEVDAAERFKAVGGTGADLFAFCSPDGIHWKRLQEAPILSSKMITIPHVHLFDSQNLVFWSESENCFVCYFRIWDGIRKIARSTSKDFRTWTPAVLMRQEHRNSSGELDRIPEEHLYTNQTSPYFRAPHIYLATAARFFEGRRVLTDQQAAAIHVNPKYFQDTSDAVLLSTRGGNTYDRTFLEGFIRPGIGFKNWVSRTNYPALNVIQTSPTELSIYVNQDYAQPTAHLHRYSLRLDGFSSVHANAEEGELLTKYFKFAGEELAINFSTSAGGGLKLQLEDEHGKPINRFTLNECQEQIGNEIDRVVSWGKASVGELSGRIVRLRIAIKDADLYSFQFRQRQDDPQ